MLHVEVPILSVLIQPSLKRLADEPISYVRLVSGRIVRIEAVPATVRSWDGVLLPIPTLPFAFTVNIVALVDEETRNAGLLPAVPYTSSFASGEVVPIPTAPVV
jgi:hypothetical protein